MCNAWQVVVLKPLGQVSPNGPPALILPLPPFISPSLSSPNTPLLFCHHYTHLYTPHHLFIPSKCSHSYCVPALPLCPSAPYFRFFGPFFAIPLLPVPSSIIAHPFPLPFKALHPLPGPFHPPAPAFPLAPIFAFLDDL